MTNIDCYRPNLESSGEGSPKGTPNVWKCNISEVDFLITQSPGCLDFLLEPYGFGFVAQGFRVGGLGLGPRVLGLTFLGLGFRC